MHARYFAIGRRRTALALLGLAAAPASGVCINEVLYDPEGPDGGREFVELYHAGPQALDLEGWRIEAGNGASAGDWRVQWEGRAGDLVAPDSFFLIAGEEVDAPAQARARLVLQNGPDAVRLCAPGGVADLLGWGEHTHAEFHEGSPAPDVVAGSSLARIADGVDSGDNARDFRAAARPTPGRSGAIAAALSLGGFAVAPPVLDGCHAGSLELTLQNDGLSPLALHDLAWDLQAELLRGEPPDWPRTALEPGESLVVAWTVRPGGEGVDSVVVTLRGPDLEAVAAVRVRCGAGEILITEIQYDPAAGEGEWVELWNRSDREIDLAGWSLSDATGRATRIAAPALFEAGGCRLVAEDSAALAARCPGTGGLILARQGAWPALNNHLDAERGYADEVVVRAPGGLAADYARYSPGGLDGGGVSLERWIEGTRIVDPCAWMPCPAGAGSTPGELPAGAHGAGSAHGDLVPAPALLRPDRAGEPRACRIALAAPEEGTCDVTAEIYALDGRRVATLAAGRVSGPLLLFWDGTDGAGEDLPTGLYLVRAALRSAARRTERRLLQPIALVRE